MSKEPLDAVEANNRLMSRLAMLIPGYHGYKAKELRREADRLVRNYLFQQLTLSKNDLKLVFQRIVDNKLTDDWTDMDRIITDLDTVAQEFNHAAYGYSGFFDAVRVEEKNLNNMVDYDTKLIDNAGSLDVKVKAFKNDVLSGNFETARTHMDDIRTAVDILDKLYSERKNVILGV